MKGKQPPKAIAVPRHAIVRAGSAEQQAVVTSVDVLANGSREQRRQMLREVKRNARRGDHIAKALLERFTRP